MRKSLVVGAWLLFATVASADPEFVKSLPAQDFTGAGLQKLTPEELARLEALVQRFKSGEVVQQAKPQSDSKQTEVPKATEPKQAVATTTAAPQAEAKTTKSHAAEAQKHPSWYSALLTLNKAAKDTTKTEKLVGRLVGEFRGWTGTTVFVLEDGTRWQQQNRNDKYDYAPALKSPTVYIKPATLTGFWLEIEGVNMSVRVIPIDLSGQK